MPVIPVNVITGPLGVGKTTAIARLLADKPQDAFWLVVLNEFTDTGVDALTLAMQARGRYDLRLIPGGCLCCTGEEDFRRQLSSVLAQDASQWPARILIEPSGIGHPGGMIEELRLFERTGALQLQSTIALIDAARMDSDDPVTCAQIAAADVLLLAKADQADATTRARFLKFADAQFPLKRLAAFSEHGQIPPAALQPPAAPYSFEVKPDALTLVRPAIHQSVHQGSHAHDMHDHAHEPYLQRVSDHWAGQPVERAEFSLLQRHACGWKLPRELMFDRNALQLLCEDRQRWAGVERFKAVLRVDVEAWLMLHRWDDQLSITVGTWHADNRMEIQMQSGEQADWLAWHHAFAQLAQRCPVG